MNLEVYNKKNPEDNIGVIYDTAMSEEDAEDNNVMNTLKDVFRTLYSKEWYRIVGFNELAFGFTNQTSYRQAVRMLNSVMNENDFSENGTPNNEAKAKVYMPDKRKIRSNLYIFQLKI